ncbi:MAG: hypothetical protein HY549_00795 [Elusimicrobia bacterium]|nr:hypothetical protein [Elusimicrobiota bacterium]
MRKIFLFVLLSGLSAHARAAEARKAGDLGLGAIVGVPIGGTAKYWITDRVAGDLAMGVHSGEFHAQWDLLTTLRTALPQPRRGSLPLYVGLGMAVRDEKDTWVGLRFVGGVSYFLPDDPIEIFAEIAPALEMTPDAAGDIQGAVGLRYYFSLR